MVASTFIVKIEIDMKKIQLIMLVILFIFNVNTAMAKDEFTTPKEIFMNAINYNAELMSNSFDGDMRVRVLPTNNENYRNFVKGGILRVSEEAYLRLENGMASVYFNELSQGPKDFKSTCFILVDPDNPRSQNGLYKALLESVNGNVERATMFLVAHETGHCMAFYERDVTLKKRTSFKWSVEEGMDAGIQPDAFNRTFGNNPASIQYNSKINELYSDKAQRQYDERVADVFAAILTSKLYHNTLLLDAAKTVRGRDNPNNAHYTLPALEQVKSYETSIAKADHIYKLWHIAREIQRKVDVDVSLKEGSNSYRDPIVEAIKREREQNKNEP